MQTEDDNDSLSRDEKGEWRPDYLCRYAPLFVWPPQPKNLLKWIFGWSGFLWPYNAFHFALAIVTWYWLTPDVSSCKSFQPGWISLMLLRNTLMVLFIYGGHHLALYTLKLHGTKRKYRKQWQETNSKRFLFGNQVYDNVFRTLGLGSLFWTAYEVLYMWSLANGNIPLMSARQSPIIFGITLLLIPIWREIHFYAIHRLIHWGPLFRRVHRIHHLNYNPGPWAGMAMHWFEMLLYFSVTLIHWIVPSHPIHFLFNAQLTALTPAYGHHGFEGPLFEGRFPTGSYFHYLHHRYVTCNFGEATIPLDKWFGRFYNGTGPYKTKK